MKNLLLLSLLFLPASAFARDGLIDVPDGAVSAPTTTDVESLVSWTRARLLADKKNVMASRTITLPYFSEAGKAARCLGFHAAFGFEELSDTDYRLNCFASQSKKEISHVLFYRMNITYSPADCGSEQAVRNFFSQAGNLSEQSARAYLRSCAFSAAPADPANVFERVTPVTQEYVDQQLANDAELEAYVNDGTKKKKTGTGKSPAKKYTNPLKNSSGS